MTAELRAMRPDDWDDVRRIYRQGIASGLATFETEVPGWLQWDAGHLPGLRLVATDAGALVGWAALSGVSDRACYRGVAEDSVYVDPAHRGQGTGGLLLARLVHDAERAGIWTVQAGIFPANVASVALHERCGFRRVGIRERIGRLDGEWHDVLLMERRSAEP